MKRSGGARHPSFSSGLRSSLSTSLISPTPWSASPFPCASQPEYHRLHIIDLAFSGFSTRGEPSGILTHSSSFRYYALADGCTHVVVLASAPRWFDSGIGGFLRGLSDVLAQETLLSPTPEVRAAWRLRRSGGGLPSARRALGIPDREWLHLLSRHPAAWSEALGALACWSANNQQKSVVHTDRYVCVSVV